MGYQENEDVYLCLSRKELQGLCKKHGLPANRSHTHLAKSLVSFFMRKNASPAPSEERSSSLVQASFVTLPVQESKPEETVNSLEEFKKACKRRMDVSEADSCGATSFVKEHVGHDKRHSQAPNQVEIGSNTITQISAKALNTAANVVCAYAPNNGISEGFGCSTSDPRNVHIQPLGAINTQESTVLPQLGFHDGGNNNKSPKYSGPRNSVGDFPAAKDGGTSNVPPVRCRNKNIGESSTESCPVSCNEISTEVPPSFEYFVSSEEGLNLYIDLNSDPVDWIQSLKNEVCIHQKANHENSRILCHEIRELDACKNLITSSVKNYEKDSQAKVVERDTGYTKCSLRSIVSENCHSLVYLPDTTDGTSGSSALKSMRTNVEISGHLDEGNQVLSSSCVTYSDAQNCVASDILSCPGDGEALPQNSADTSSIMKESHASAPDGSLNKRISNLGMNLSTDEIRKSDLLENWTPKTDIIYSQNVEADFLGSTLKSASEKNSLYFPRKPQVNLKLSDVGSLENLIGSRQISPASGSMEIQLLEVASQHKETSTTQFGGQPVLDCLMNDVQSDVGDSANHFLDQQACDGIGSSAVEYPKSAVNEERDRSISVKDKENSECSQINNLLDKSRKRSHSSEFPEEFESKRQQVNSGIQKGTMMNLRSMKTLARESIRESGVLRRSVRLVSKSDQLMTHEYLK